MYTVLDRDVLCTQYWTGMYTVLEHGCTLYIINTVYTVYIFSTKNCYIPAGAAGVGGSCATFRCGSFGLMGGRESS